MGLSGDTSARIAAAARDHLVAELQRTVETVEAETRRQAEEAAERIAAISDDGAARLRALLDEIAREAAEIRERLLAAAELDAPAPERASPASLDEIDRARDSIRNAPRASHVRLRRFRRGEEPLEGVAEGVRIVVRQMRLLGRSETEIAAQLTEMGVEDPTAVIERVSS